MVYGWLNRWLEVSVTTLGTSSPETEWADEGLLGGCLRYFPPPIKYTEVGWIERRNERIVGRRGEECFEVGEGGRGIDEGEG